MLNRHLRALAPVLLGSLLAIVLALHLQNVQALESEYEFDDAHFHLTNYIQESTPIREFLKIMGNTTGRSVLFGIPLQQQWSYRVSGDNAPTVSPPLDAAGDSVRAQKAIADISNPLHGNPYLPETAPPRTN